MHDNLTARVNVTLPSTGIEIEAIAIYDFIPAGPANSQYDHPSAPGVVLNMVYGLHTGIDFIDLAEREVGRFQLLPGGPLVEMTVADFITKELETFHV